VIAEAGATVAVSVSVVPRVRAGGVAVTVVTVAPLAATMETAAEVDVA
jgi:hypothetical protein